RAYSPPCDKRSSTRAAADMNSSSGWPTLDSSAQPPTGVSVAEREGFEPPVHLRVLRISSAARSTTLPPLRGRRSGAETLTAGSASRLAWAVTAGKTAARPRKPERQRTSLNGPPQPPATQYA